MQDDLEQESMEPKIIRTQDENGEIHDFELVDILTIDEQEYGLLVHLNTESESEEEEDDEEEVVIMRLSKQDDAYSFETIEDEEEFEKVVSFLESDENYELVEEEEEEEA